VEIIRAGKKMIIHPSKVFVGDIMIADSGVSIPADCILLAGEDLQTTEAEMTGETENIKKLTIDECI
jgi:P-type E1-E2 ATPase